MAVALAEVEPLLLPLLLLLLLLLLPLLLMTSCRDLRGMLLLRDEIFRLELSQRFRVRPERLGHFSVREEMVFQQSDLSCI